MIGSFNGSKFSRFFGWPLQLSWDMEGSQTLTDDILKSAGCVVRRPWEKNYFFNDSGKALQLKRIILRVCEIEVSERDELPKFCCRSCHDKVLRLNKNLEIFASTCKSTRRNLNTNWKQVDKKTSRNGLGREILPKAPKSQEKYRTQWWLQHENVYLLVTRKRVIGRWA